MHAVHAVLAVLAALAVHAAAVVRYCGRSISPSRGIRATSTRPAHVSRRAGTTGGTTFYATTPCSDDGGAVHGPRVGGKPQRGARGVDGKPRRNAHGNDGTDGRRETGHVTPALGDGGIVLYYMHKS